MRLMSVSLKLSMYSMVKTFGVEVIEHAEPTLRGNHIHHQRMGGLWVYKEARGLYEGNEIAHNAKAGVRVWDLGHPTMQQNKIHSGNACGILIYELFTGGPPFAAQLPMQIYAKVMKGINQVSFPTTCQGPAQDLVKALLTKDPSERLPMRPPGFVKNLKTHEWYKGFDWDAMMRQELTPPYKPQVRGKKDIANFHARREDMPQHMDFKDDGSGWDAEFAS